VSCHRLWPPTRAYSRHLSDSISTNPATLSRSSFRISKTPSQRHLHAFRLACHSTKLPPLRLSLDKLHGSARTMWQVRQILAFRRSGGQAPRQRGGESVPLVSLAMRCASPRADTRAGMLRCRTQRQRSRRWPRTPRPRSRHKSAQVGPPLAVYLFWQRYCKTSTRPICHFWDDNERWSSGWSVQTRP
jgi:hypothetical protein